MAIRAQPVKSVFQRMSRIVREVADATGKTVRLMTEGEDTEVDKTVIERLADPLTHMIRNAIDHGLEKPEARRAAPASPPKAWCASPPRIARAASSSRCPTTAAASTARGQGVAVEQGADRRRGSAVRQRDRQSDLPARLLDRRQRIDISGRGVGMDVVKRSIQALGGRISIASRPGRGSTFTMSLPLTLAVLDGMVVRVADQTLVVPLTAIVETLKPKAAEVRDLGELARDLHPRQVRAADRRRPASSATAARSPTR